ncbi:MAG: cysteine--tRNA ligase [Candidatus Moraniibacteriota bacterium]
MFKIYNSLTRKKEEFKPIYKGKVGMYVCGPTVYDHCHIGHARGYVSMDTFRKYLEYLGYEVRYIMNYTDVGHLVNDAEIGEDKIEKKAKAEKVDPMEIVENYINSAKEDFKALNVKPANFNPRPTQYIAQIIKFIEDLIQKDYAYEANGSVYFSVNKFPEYGKLSGRKTEELIEGARVEVNLEKKNPLDFAVWIKADNEHILKWPSPWSTGYPGWHIECSVMSCDLLGQDTFDIHGGGNENIFPHNENEIAQSEAYIGKKMANYWTLWNMVNINGEKMSKSKGNHTSVKDILKEYDPMVIRLWILSSHYRSIVNYTSSVLTQAQTNLQKITDWVNKLKNLGIEKSDEKINISKYQEKFEEAMNDDLNTPIALSVLYELITESNSLIANDKLNKESTENILKFWEKINKVFGLILKTDEIKEIPKEVIVLSEDRKKARENKDFQLSDELRNKIENLGYFIEDLKDNNYLIKPAHNASPSDADGKQ